MKTTAIAILAVLTASAWAQTPINENAPAARDGSVIISNVSGSVKITGWDKDEVSVTGTLGKNAERLEFVPSPTETLIRVVIPRFARRVGPSQLDISVPAGSRIDVETVSADIDLTGISGAVEASSVSGDITLAGTMPKVKLETVSGNGLVRSTDVDVDAESVSGDLAVTATTAAVEMETVSGDAQVSVETLRAADFESVSGDIRMEGGVTPDAEIRVKTHSGDIECALPPEASANVKFRSFSGDLDGSDFNVSGGEKNAEATLGSGAARIILDTFSGSAQLKNLKVGGEIRMRYNNYSR